MDYSGQAYDAMLRSALRSESARDPSRRPAWEEPPRCASTHVTMQALRPCCLIPYTCLPCHAVHCACCPWLAALLE